MGGGLTIMVIMMIMIISSWTRPHGAQVNISWRGFYFLLDNFLGEVLGGFIVALRREFLGEFLCEFLVNFLWISREYFRSFFFDTVAFKRNAFFPREIHLEITRPVFQNPTCVYTSQIYLQSTCKIIRNSRALFVMRGAPLTACATCEIHGWSCPR